MLTVKQLKEALKDVPDHLVVCVASGRDHSYTKTYSAYMTGAGYYPISQTFTERPDSLPDNPEEEERACQIFVLDPR